MTNVNKWDIIKMTFEEDELDRDLAKVNESFSKIFDRTNYHSVQRIREAIEKVWKEEETPNGMFSALEVHTNKKSMILKILKELRL